MASTPPAEVDVTEGLVRSLLATQHPDLADLELRLVGNGWDNSMWRLGERLAVRVPRRELAAPLIVNEQRWLPVLARLLPVPVPAPVRAGVPTTDYPWRWSVVPWVDGRRATTVLGAAARPLAGPLARFLVALHTPAPEDAPTNVFRGVPLASRDEIVRERLAGAELASLLDRDLPDVPDAGARLTRLWEDAVAAPEWDREKLWLHGDLHPANLVVTDDGALAAVIDFGDINSGDPATDLSIAWTLFDAAGRAELRDAVDGARGWDTAVWLRARGWALLFGTIAALHADDAPEFRPLGAHTLRAVLEH